MTFRRRAALLAGLAALVVCVVGGTTERSTAGNARAGAATKASRLVAFPSCGALLDYAKTRAARFVGPWGFGAVAPQTPPRQAPPKQRVDYSPTNAHEESV